MPVQNKIMTVGVGSLIFGESDSGLDASAEVTSIKLTPSAKSGDTLVFLNGDTGQSTTEYTYKLSADVVQNLSLKGIVGYMHKNKGQIVKVVFVPNTADGAKFEGNVRLDPPEVGGDVGKADLTKIELEFIGTPTFTPAAKVNGLAP